MTINNFEATHHKNNCKVFNYPVEECSCGETKKQDWETEFEKFYKGAMMACPLDEHQKWMKVFISELLSTQEEKIRKEEREKVLTELKEEIDRQDWLASDFSSSASVLPRSEIITRLNNL